MITPKYKLEQQIKKQIENREITPGRNLWAEIENQTGIKNTRSTNTNWLLAAACLLLMLSLGIFLTDSSEDPAAPMQVTANTLSGETVKPQNAPESKLPEITLREEKPALVKNAQPASVPKEIASLPEPVLKENTVTSPELKEQPSKMKEDQSPAILAAADSGRIPANRKSFVDPATLLFSVEHKDIIEKSKEGSNVATIDLNPK